MPVDFSSLLQQLQRSQNQANKANEARYQAGLAELSGSRDLMRSLYEQAGTTLSGLGESAKTDIEMGAQRALGAGRQSLISSGLGNTTIAAGLPRGVEEDRRRSMERVEEGQAQQRVGLMTQQAGAEMGGAGQIADFISARQDRGPDMGLYANLLASMAAGQAASQPITQSAGLGANARAGLDAFGQPLGKYSGGGGGSGGGALSMGSGGGGGSPATSSGGGMTHGTAWGNEDKYYPQFDALAIVSPEGGGAPGMGGESPNMTSADQEFKNWFARSGWTQHKTGRLDSESTATARRLGLIK